MQFDYLIEDLLPSHRITYRSGDLLDKNRRVDGKLSLKPSSKLVCIYNTYHESGRRAKKARSIP